mgnify:CR=1 FL=1
MPRKPKYLNTLRFVCTHCSYVHELEVHDGMNIRIGTTIYPYSGGGPWGKCRRCGKSGLRAIEEVPRPKKGPVGWRNIPKT